MNRRDLLREAFGVSYGRLASTVMQYQSMSDSTLRRWIRLGLLRRDRGLVEITDEGERLALSPRPRRMARHARPAEEP